MSNFTVEVLSPQGGQITVTDKVFDLTRSWVYNDTGTASFVIWSKDPKASTVLGRGNLIRIWQYGAPTWIGLITQRSYNNYTVSCQLRSAEWLLEKRMMQQSVRVTAPAGTVAREAVNSAGSVRGFWWPLWWGAWDWGGPSVFGEYVGYKELYPTLQDLAERSGYAFWVGYDLSLNWVAQRGYDRRSHYILYEDKELIDVSLNEDEENVVTHILGIGDGSDIATRPKWGGYIPNNSFFRSEPLSVSGAANPESLVAPVQAALQAGYAPETTIDCTLVNINNIFAWIQIGDLFMVSLKQAFNRVLQVRVEGLELDSSGKMRLVCKVIAVVPATTAVQYWTPS